VTSALHWQLQVTAEDCFGRHPERRCFEKKRETTERARSDRDRDGSSRERLVAVASLTFEESIRQISRIRSRQSSEMVAEAVLGVLRVLRGDCYGKLRFPL